MFKVAVGEDSHRFDFSNKNKKLVLGGALFDKAPAFYSNSDGDVIYHSITNAISGITGVNILGEIADDMCKKGIIDSKEYLKKSLEYLEKYRIIHISISIECKIPKITPRINEIKENISNILNLDVDDIGITATTGEELTEVGKGNGVHAFSIITVEKIKK